MRNGILLFLFISPVLLFAQVNTRVETDTSIIETKYYTNLNSIRVFNELKNETKIYYKEFYCTTKKIKSEGIFIDKNSVGIWKEFSEKGKLIREINYSKSVITFFDKSYFPFLELQNMCRMKGDSLIKKIYSDEFFKKYVRWNISSSYIYNDLESGNWIDTFRKKPTKFLLRYNVRIDDEVYNDLIEFEIDERGKLTSDAIENCTGFEKLPKKSSKTFKINYTKAIALARENGLVANRLSKMPMILVWDKLKSTGLYNGKFRIYLIDKIKSIKASDQKERHSIVDKFDVYVLNPWTAEFLEKKKMKSIRSWERLSGNSTGLLPDNE